MNFSITKPIPLNEKPILDNNKVVEEKKPSIITSNVNLKKLKEKKDSDEDSSDQEDINNLF